MADLWLHRRKGVHQALFIFGKAAGSLGELCNDDKREMQGIGADCISSLGAKKHWGASHR
jgi:hypothetical protein